MLENRPKWEELVGELYDVEPEGVPLELRVKWVSIAIFANASRSRDKMFRQPRALTDKEWASQVIDSIGCSIELLGIIGLINFLPHTENKLAAKLYNRLQILQQEVPVRECDLQPEERQMILFIAISIKEAASIYLLCRGMRSVYCNLKDVGCY